MSNKQLVVTIKVSFNRIKNNKSNVKHKINYYNPCMADDRQKCCSLSAQPDFSCLYLHNFIADRSNSITLNTLAPFFNKDILEWQVNIDLPALLTILLKATFIIRWNTCRRHVTFTQNFVLLFSSWQNLMELEVSNCSPLIQPAQCA